MAADCRGSWVWVGRFTLSGPFVSPDFYPHPSTFGINGENRRGYRDGEVV
jgi:hypothetical protein